MLLEETKESALEVVERASHEDLCIATLMVSITMGLGISTIPFDDGDWFCGLTANDCSHRLLSSRSSY